MTNKNIRLIEKGKEVGIFILKENKFDYDIFKKHIAKIDIIYLTKEKAIDNIIEITKKQGADFIFTEVNKKNTRLIRSLKNKKFSPICCNVLLRSNCKKRIKPIKTDLELRSYKKKDLKQIKDIAKKTSTISHFYLDKNFKNKTHLFYEKWAENDCKKGNVFVCLKNKKVVGFVSYKKTGKKGRNVADISLVRVSKQHQGEGIGTILINFSLGKLKNFDFVDIETTDENYAALKAYEKNGLRIIQNRVCFHKKLNKTKLMKGGKK